MDKSFWSRLPAIRVDVAAAFLLVMVCMASPYLWVTLVAALGVSRLTLVRWGPPAPSAGHALGIQLAFLLCMWVSAAACTMAFQATVFALTDLSTALVLLLIALGLTFGALTYLSGRVNTWWRSR